MGGIREDRISQSILNAISQDTVDQRSILSRLKALFAVIHLALARWRNDLFSKLRRDVWGLQEEEYKQSFRRDMEGRKKARLIPVGDLGYSGSVCTQLLPNPL